MARPAETRSPSPTGSAFSSSRRNYKDGDRFDRNRRDDGRGHRRRSRSRSPDRYYRSDRDFRRRRERSIDRRDDRRSDYAYRPSGERSREHRRSRDREDGRDYRHRSQERDNRTRRDDSRDRNRRRRDDSTDSRPKSRRDERNLKDAKRNEPPKPPALVQSIQLDEQKKAERLAKLEAWKKKQAAANERKQQELRASGGARQILADMDKKSALAQKMDVSKTVVSVTAAIEIKEEKEPAESDQKIPNGSLKPYAGKFDPKAIAKKANEKIVSSTLLPLGSDADIPTVAQSDASNHTAASSKVQPLKARGNVSGFGFGPKATDTEKTKKRALDFGDEERSRKKLEKLPDFALESTPYEDNATTNGVDEDDGENDLDMQEGGTEEEAAAAARAAVEKRRERLREQAEQDVVMTDASPTAAAAPPQNVEDEVDPLDAFMSSLVENPLPKRGSKKSSLNEPEAMFSDDEYDYAAVEPDPDDILALATKSKKKKAIPKVDHSKIDYESFRRSFYVEPEELATLNEEQVAELRLELDDIKIRGLHAPKPVQKWAQCGLGMQVLDAIQRLGFEKPSPIQSQAIPAIMSGRDVIGVAKTGSGKTIAFLLPMFRHIMDQRPIESLEGPIALILAPTRELATQIHKECKPFAKALNLRAVCAYGGAPIKDQIADLKRGAEIVVCTPGRLIDLLAANSGRVTNLRRVTYTVLDEADRMFDLGFGPQIDQVIGSIRPDRQTVLFSATFPSKMEQLAKKTLTKPLEIIVGGRAVVAPEITQIVEVRTEQSKFARLLEVLGELFFEKEDEDIRALIFVERQEAADKLFKELTLRGYRSSPIHGGMDQIDRDSNILDFKKGDIQILIATSVAARGLDVKQLKLVVNYDAPNHLEDYVHRAGRTGRAGNKGTAVTFLTPEQDRFAVDIAKALRQSEQKVPEDVEKMAHNFLERVKAGKEQGLRSGFGGKGLDRLDQERDAAKARERKTYAQDGDEEEKEEKPSSEDKKIAHSQSAVQVSIPNHLHGVPPGIDLDGKIVVHRTEPNMHKGKNPLDKVGQAVANIHSRLNQAGQLRPIDNKGPDAGAYHATLEINDFPQKARWAVTNRTNVAKILEATGTSITTKGSFYPAGKTPGPGEKPKLYILVEGDTEVVVTNAMRELTRLLKEGTMAAADSDARAPTSGRYSVV